MKVRELIQRLCAEDMDADVIFYANESERAHIDAVLPAEARMKDGSSASLVCLCGNTPE